jgi:phosphoribosylformylglycinamidine synthase
VPITGGNVSLYNETDGQPILPTPVIGIVGVIDDASRVLTRPWPSGGLDVVLLGENYGELGGSEYLKIVHGLLRGRAPALNLSRERSLHRLLVELAAAGLIKSAHDCADGGLAVAIAECCFETGGIGVDVGIDRAFSDGGVDLASATLFGESASRVIVTTLPASTPGVINAARIAGLPVRCIGQTGGSSIRIAVEGQAVIDCAVSAAESRWSTALSDWLEGRAA